MAELNTRNYTRKMASANGEVHFLSDFMFVILLFYEEEF